MHSVQGPWRLLWLLLASSLLAGLLSRWLRQQPLTAARLFGPEIMQWPAAAALAAAYESSPAAVLLAAAVPALGMLRNLRGCFQGDSGRSEAVMQALSHKRAAALQLAGELQSYSILQEAAAAVADAAGAALRRLRLLL